MPAEPVGLDAGEHALGVVSECPATQAAVVAVEAGPHVAWIYAMAIPGGFGASVAASRLSVSIVERKTLDAFVDRSVAGTLDR